MELPGKFNHISINFLTNRKFVVCSYLFVYLIINSAHIKRELEINWTSKNKFLIL